MYKKGLLFVWVLVFCLSGSELLAQNDLVPNGSFETKAKIKREGMIEYAEPWYSPTDVPADIYSKAGKDDFATPENRYGRETPEDGDCYAGIVAYSHRDAQPRTYLTVQLKKPLVAGKTYCVKMNVSLSDISKYASNGLGIYLSPKKIQTKHIVSNTIQPQVKHSKDKIMDDQYVWEPICQIYRATGGEKYMAIGNFLPTASTKVKKMKRPSGFTTPQKSNAYYFIENVSIINMVELEPEDCQCEPEDEQMAVSYNQNVSTEIELEDDKLLELKKVFFEKEEIELEESDNATLNAVADLLKKNPAFRVQIQGHTDAVEQLTIKEGDDDMSALRAAAVKKFLVTQGVPAGQLSTKAFQDSSPATDDQSTSGLAQNRRVQFVITNK